jgi:hypothetical protein
MEMNVEKKLKVKRMFREPSPVRIIIDQKHVECFNCVGSMITNDARCTREIKSRIAVAKSVFNKKKTFFYQQIGRKFKEETSEMLHLEHRFVWC